jgi:dihydrofolate synthase / folylpolyglutamate synthase
MPNDEQRIHELLDTLKQKPQVMTLGLERMQSFFKKHPIHRMPCPLIIVGGTNGKGSCVQTLTQLYLSQGYRVGSYTSPHLHSITERICINGKPAHANDFLNALTQCMQQAQPLNCSYFEILTLTACQFFQDHPCDVLVFEVGLGGRLDAVNALEPDLSIITTIDLDHQNYLGNERDAIGFEKAAIARPLKPLIYASHNPPNTLINYLHKIKAKPIFAEKDYHVTVHKNGHWSFAYQKIQLAKLPPCNLPMPSVAAALTACHVLKKTCPMPLPEKIPQALAEAKLPGRFEVRQTQGKTLILDVAHNPEAARLLQTKLINYRKKHPYQKLIALCACMADKDHQGLCAPLIDLIDTWHLTTFTTAKAASPTTLQSCIQSHDPNIKTYCHNDIHKAYKAALANTTEKDALLIFGSFITLATLNMHHNTSTR